MPAHALPLHRSPLPLPSPPLLDPGFSPRPFSPSSPPPPSHPPPPRPLLLPPAPRPRARNRGGDGRSHKRRNPSPSPPSPPPPPPRPPPRPVHPPLLLPQEAEEEQLLLSRLEARWKAQQLRSAGEGSPLRRPPLASPLSPVRAPTWGAGPTGPGVYSPSSPFYFTYFSTYPMHSSRVGPRYQADVQPMLTPAELAAPAEAERFPEHRQPISSPAEFATAAPRGEGLKHFSTAPWFPAFSYVVQRLLSPPLLAYHRAQWEVKAEQRKAKLGSVRVGRGRRSTRLTPQLATAAQQKSGPGKTPLGVRGVDQVPLVWERMMASRGGEGGEGGDGRERTERLVQAIRAMRQKERREREKEAAKARKAGEGVGTASAGQVPISSLSRISAGVSGGRTVQDEAGKAGTGAVAGRGSGTGRRKRARTKEEKEERQQKKRETDEATKKKEEEARRERMEGVQVVVGE